MKVYHVSDPSRASTGITQGLMAMGFELKVSTPYMSFGKEILSGSNIDNIKNADLVFLTVDRSDLFPMFEKHNMWKRVICYDYRDTNAINPIANKVSRYFKRSITSGIDRRLMVNAKVAIPINHCALNEYYSFVHQEITDVGCFFNRNFPKHLGERRVNLVETVAKHNLANSLIGHSTGQKNEARLALRESEKDNCFLEFLKLQSACKIIFTAQPTHVEGDNRTWEAMASGALVFMDIMYHPTIKPLRDGEHCFYHDSAKIETIEDNIDKAKWYLKHDRKRRKIAEKGFEFTKKYHRPINRIKQMLDIKMA